MFQSNQMSIGDWFIYHILLVIPIVNIIVFIMLITNPKTNPSLRNLMLMQLIIFVIAIVIFIGALGSLMQNL